MSKPSLIRDRPRWTCQSGDRSCIIFRDYSYDVWPLCCFNLKIMFRTNLNNIVFHLMSFYIISTYTVAKKVINTKMFARIKVLKSIMNLLTKFSKILPIFIFTNILKYSKSLDICHRCCQLFINKLLRYLNTSAHHNQPFTCPRST